MFASLWFEEVQKTFGDTVKYRTDKYSDGDVDKERSFFVLRNTIGSAFLCELGFHTNKEEAERMITDEWKDKVVESFVNWALKIEGK